MTDKQTTEAAAHNTTEGSARFPYVAVAAGETQALIERLRDACPAARDAIMWVHLERHTSVDLPLLWDEFWASKTRSAAHVAIKVGEGRRKEESHD